jgi:hypothetical protein
VQIVEALEEQQISDLLDDFERIGNAARLEGIPEGINLVANSSRNHGRLAIAGIVISERRVGKKGVAYGGLATAQARNRKAFPTKLDCQCPTGCIEISAWLPVNSGFSTRPSDCPGRRNATGCSRCESKV